MSKEKLQLCSIDKRNHHYLLGVYEGLTYGVKESVTQVISTLKNLFKSLRYFANIYIVLFVQKKYK